MASTAPSSAASPAPASWYGRPSARKRAAAEARAFEVRHGPAETWGDLAPDRAEAAGGGQHADRVDAEIEVVGRELLAAARSPRSFTSRAASRPRAPASSRKAISGSITPFSAASRSSTLRRGQAVAAGAGRPGEHQHQGVGAAFEIGERLGVGGCEVGMIDPLGDPPGTGCAHRLGWPARPTVERLDPQAVGRPGDQPLLEVGALQDALDEAEPARPVGGLEEVGERCVCPSE